MLCFRMPPFSYQRAFGSLRTVNRLTFQPRRNQYSRSYIVPATRTYDDAVGLLNTLQTPYKTLAYRRSIGMKYDDTVIDFMRRCLDRIGYSQNDLEKLNIVHVAGTKGKGSVCAYVDSILGQYHKSHDIPRKVGLYTSPHLIAVRERIRINSVPISRELFAKYFFEVWDLLDAAEAANPEKNFQKPAYFRYLTLMSYHVFLQEGVDAAVYETGVGGEFDSTNVVDRPVATGISTIGIDHVYSLGTSHAQIAWHKAGIQKKDVPSFTVSQNKYAFQVIQARAKEKYARRLKVVNDLDPRLEGLKIHPDARFQRGNAALAIALAETVLKKLDPSFKKKDKVLQKEFVDGIEKVVWRGRCETKVDGNITWYLDGAHTADSIKVAATWFGDESSKKTATRCLIFNQQGERDAVELLETLFNVIVTQGKVKFDHVIFCTTKARPEMASRDSINHTLDNHTIDNMQLQREFAWRWRAFDPSPDTAIEVVPTIEDALEYVRALDDKHVGEKGVEIHTFITGSVHLIGRAIGALDGVDAA